MTHDPHRHRHAQPTSDATFHFDVQRSEEPVLLAFHADWCGACQRLAPVLDELANDYDGRVKVAKIDVERNPRTAERLGVRSIPTLILFDGGEQRMRLTNVIAKRDITDELDNALPLKEASP